MDSIIKIRDRISNILDDLEEVSKYADCTSIGLNIYYHCLPKDIMHDLFVNANDIRQTHLKEFNQNMKSYINAVKRSYPDDVERIKVCNDFVTNICAYSEMMFYVEGRPIKVGDWFDDGNQMIRCDKIDPFVNMLGNFRIGYLFTYFKIDNNTVIYEHNNMGSSVFYYTDEQGGSNGLAFRRSQNPMFPLPIQKPRPYKEEICFYLTKKFQADERKRSHISCIVNICTAIASMKERSGSSHRSIKKALGAKKSKWCIIDAALKIGVANGDLIKRGGKYTVSSK